MTSSNFQEKMWGIYFILVFSGYPFFSALAVVFNADILIILFRFLLLMLSFYCVFCTPRFFPRKLFYELSPFIFFFFMCFIRIAYDFSIDDSATMGARHYFIGFIFQLVIPSISFVGIVCLLKNQERIVKLLLVSLSISILMNMYLSYMDVLSVGTYGVRWGTEKFNPISFGHSIITAWAAAISLLFYVGHLTPRKLLIGSVVTFAAFLCIFLTGSRGPLITFILIIFIYFHFTGKILQLLGLLLLTFSLFLLSMTLLESLFFQDDISVFVDRLLNVGTKEDASSSIRLSTYSAGLEQFMNSPIFGSGFEEKTTKYYVHNIFLEALMAFGLFGGMLTIFIFLRPVIIVYKFKLLKKVSDEPLLVFFFITIVQYLLGGQVSASLISANNLIPSIFALYTIIYTRKLEVSK